MVVYTSFAALVETAMLLPSHISSSLPGLTPAIHHLFERLL
jgi:hypothetical protein